MSQSAIQSQRHIPAHVTMSGILQMVLRNGIANAVHTPTRPCTSTDLNKFRTVLLRDPFFDPRIQAEELSSHLQPNENSMLFADLVVLMARIIRVLMFHAPLTETQMRERVAVRKDALSEPFFDREKASVFGTRSGA